MLQRRQRNQILRLKIENEGWLEDEDELNDHIRDYFQNLLTTVGQRNVEEVLDHVECRVSKAMNQDLL